MTYRERREARAAQLLIWADSHERQAEASFAAVHAIADMIPLGQPILVGHHSEGRARRDAERITRGMERGIEHSQRADAYRRRADNIELAADHAIYSDDADAPERLRQRIADLEAQRSRIVAYNAACRRAGKATREAVALLDDRQRGDLDSIARYASFQLRDCGAFPAYATSNLSGNIARLRDRLARLGA